MRQSAGSMTRRAASSSVVATRTALLTHAFQPRPRREGSHELATVLQQQQRARRCHVSPVRFHLDGSFKGVMA